MFLVCLLLFACMARAQNKYSITGYVKDSLSSENLIGATITFNGQQKGVNSNGYGFYSITLPEGHYQLTSSYVGYVSKNVEINLDRNISLNFLINLRASASEEVVVYAKKKDLNVTSAQMGKIDLLNADVLEPTSNAGSFSAGLLFAESVL